MSKVRVLQPNEAAELVRDGVNIVTSGFVGSCCPETLSIALEKRFLETGHPRDLNFYYVSAQGNKGIKGAGHFAHKGMVKRVVGGHWNMTPGLGELSMNEEIEAYNFPQGTLSQLFRDIAGKRIGTITHVGLNTYVDPRIEGGKLNKKTTEDLVELITIKGEEKLLYKAFPVDVCFLRGTYADENGNISMDKEVASLEMTAIAQACKNSGGIVLVQVEKIVAAGSLNPKLVKIPHIYVDGIVISKPEEHEQCFECEYDESMTGLIRVPLSGLDSVSLNPKKVIARRAALELEKDSVVNLGIGIPEFISLVANEEGVGDRMTLTVEAGAIGGVPQGGMKFGGSVNPDCILDEPYQFDFYDGGGVDQAFLGLAQVDEAGNINVSKFSGRVVGCGGFINISQNAKKVYYCGTFTTKGLKEEIKDGKLTIIQEGSSKKFVKDVEQITFSGVYAQKTKQPVMYITERAVFELRNDGLYITEIAPGIDYEKDVLANMDFVPKIPKEGIKLMDERIFKDELMGVN